MKCYFHFGSELRTGGNRILNNLKKYAFDDIEFTDYENSDVVIMHLQYKWDLDWYLHNCKKPFIFLISELQQTKEYFNQFFSNPLLKMIYTFHPLDYLGYDTQNKFIHAPWGVDTEVFDKGNKDIQKENTILTLGFYDSENYQNIYDSVRLANGKMIHLDFHYKDFLRQGKIFDHKHHWYPGRYVSDEDLIKYYQSCKFVSGLRSNCGFEAPIIEGALNYCKPICFDNIYYTKWFKDIAIFIPEDIHCDLTYNLLPYFKNADDYKMTDDEVNYVRETFNWNKIATNFWKEVKDSLGG